MSDLQIFLQNQENTLGSLVAANKSCNQQIKMLDQGIHSKRQSLGQTHQDLAISDNNIVTLNSQLLSVHQCNNIQPFADNSGCSAMIMNSTIANVGAQKEYISKVMKLQAQIAQLSEEFQCDKVVEQTVRIQAELDTIRLQLAEMRSSIEIIEQENVQQEARNIVENHSLDEVERVSRKQQTIDTQISVKTKAKLASAEMFDAEQEVNVRHEQKIIEDLEKNIAQCTPQEESSTLL